VRWLVDRMIAATLFAISLALLTCFRTSACATAVERGKVVEQRSLASHTSTAVGATTTAALPTHASSEPFNALPARWAGSRPRAPEVSYLDGSNEYRVRPRAGHARPAARARARARATRDSACGTARLLCSHHPTSSQKAPPPVASTARSLSLRSEPTNVSLSCAVKRRETVEDVRQGSSASERSIWDLRGVAPAGKYLSVLSRLAILGRCSRARCKNAHGRAPQRCGGLLCCIFWPLCSYS